MQTRTGKLLSIGLFVLVAFVAAGFLILKFGEAPKVFVGGTYPVPILFSRIGITTKGTDVLLAGKRIGQVRDIKFADPNNLANGVLVLSDIEERYRLPKNISAVESVTSVVMGRAVIQIQIL